MFWKHNQNSPSQIETILSKEDVTLEEIMNEDDILNECKVQNKLLIDFLIKPEILEELVTLTTEEPAIELEERNRFKYPNIACELLTCDIPTLNERLAGNEVLLAKLYAFLDKEPPLNPLLASFFSKIMAVLITKRAEQNWLSHQFTSLQVLDFLKAKDNFVQLLLNHLGTSAIMDLTLKLMTQVEADIRQNIINYLGSQKIIQSLVALLDPKIDRGRHHNVAQLLCDFIQTARDNLRNSADKTDTDPLLTTIESPETVSMLLDHILETEKSETAIVGGIQVLLELLGVNKSSIPKFEYPNSYGSTNEERNDQEGKSKVVETTCKEILLRLKDFHNLLLDPPKKEPTMTTVGVLNPPLGNTRIQVTRLIAALINCGEVDITQELISLGTMGVLLDLFFAFPWNNFLHTQVQACISAALSCPLPSEQGDNVALSKHLLIDCKLVERILQAWKDNDDKQLETKGIRQGYMGHLINIANNLVNLCSDGPLGDILKDNLPEVAESLNKFNETTLIETNKIQDTLLGGVHPHTSNEDSDEYGDVPYTASGLGQQNYHDYQIQQLSQNVYESYGYNDDDFKEGDDTLQSIEHRSGINFDLTEGGFEQQHELFKQMCAQNINTLDDADDQIFDDKEHTFQTVIEKEAERNSSSDSEDESPHGDDAAMEIEPWSSPNKASEAPVIMSDDPWGTSNSNAGQTTNTGWADFSSAVFDTNFDNMAFKIFGSQASESTQVENDLKLENIEIDAKDELDAKDSINIAQPTNNKNLSSGHETANSNALAEDAKASATVVEMNEQNMRTKTNTAATENDIGLTGKEAEIKEINEGV